MSFEIHMKTKQKKNLADILRSIAKFIEDSTNQTVSIDLDITLNKCGE